MRDDRKWGSQTQPTLQFMVGVLTPKPLGRTNRTYFWHGSLRSTTYLLHGWTDSQILVLAVQPLCIRALSSPCAKTEPCLIFKTWFHGTRHISRQYRGNNLQSIAAKQTRRRKKPHMLFQSAWVWSFSYMNVILTPGTFALSSQKSNILTN